MLELGGLRKWFGPIRAVDGVNLTVSPGEFCVLLGPSGCGKTTILRLIAGLEVPDEGTIEMVGEDWTRMPPQARNVAMVFQHYALYPHRSVRGNIEYPLRLRKIDQGERLRKVESISHLLGITSLLDRSPRELSGGEAQRVALARALVREPACFLMDEPLSSLDAQMRIHARAEIKQMQRKLKVTTLYVTHDQEDAIALADRIALMNEGKLVQVGTPDQLFHDPASSFVAKFLGRPPMNLLAARISREEEGYSALALNGYKGGVQSEPVMITNRLANGARVVVGFRPNCVRIETGETALTMAPAWSIPGTIVLVEGLDPDYTVHCSSPFGDILLRTHDRPTEGPVTLVLPGREAFFFDGETGDRLRDIKFVTVRCESRKSGL